jgi:two-component system, NtrC family, response regulator AtoC
MAAHCTQRIELKEVRPLFSPSPYPAKPKTIKALIVDDELSIRLALTHFLRGRGYEVQEAETGEGALPVAKTFLPDIVFLDRRLPDCDGEYLLKPLTSPEIGALVVMMTAHVELDNAVSAMKNGADYYFPKPLDLNHVAVVLEKLEEKIKLSSENEYFRRVSEMRGSDSIILGDSPQIIKVQRLTTLLARNISTPVLILGESGSGKEVVAQSIHLLSGVKGQMVEVNCASLSEYLLESELFGHEKGAFTDAKETKKGLFEIADGGTIFFDELAEMPLPIQAKLLKVLDSKKFRRVGGVADIQSSARFMAATNRDIVSMVKKGLFREDLFYRISVLPIHVPPLRERGKDITILAGYFAARISESMGKGKPMFSPETFGFLQKYDWPGNVRELKNVIERALILSNNDDIHPDHLPAEIRRNPLEIVFSPDFNDLRPLSKIKDDYIDHVLKITGNNHSRSAAILGISRSTLLAGLRKKT